MSTPTFYVLHGDDEFSRKAQITAMQEAMNDPSGMNISFLDGQEVSAEEAINAVSAVPFLADKRLVVVEGMLARLGKKSKATQPELDILVDRLPHLPEFARLVFNENKALPDKHAVVDLARSASTGYEQNFTAPKNPVQWIRQQAKNQHHVEIEPRAAAALASVIEQDLRKADSELAKAAAYVNYERPIAEADIAKLTSYVAQANIFEMVDAIGEGDGKKALTLTQQLLNEGNDPLALLSMVVRQFRLIIQAKEHLNTGHGDLGKAIGVHSFVAKKAATQSRRFELDKLEGIYHKLAEIDFKIKTGQIEAVTALQTFIAGVTE